MALTIQRLNQTLVSCSFILKLKPFLQYCFFFFFQIKGSAKPSNLRAKFENFAKLTEEQDQKRAAEQKKLREEKDKIDRDEAAKKTVTHFYKIGKKCLHNYCYQFFVSNSYSIIMRW